MFQRTEIKLACALTAKSLGCDFRQVSQNLFPCFQNDVPRLFLSLCIEVGLLHASCLYVCMRDFLLVLLSPLSSSLWGEGLLGKHMTDQNARCPLS